MVDPYIAAYDAAFNPEGPAFNAALRENLQYKIPPEGERLIADAQLFDLLVSRI